MQIKTNKVKKIIREKSDREYPEELMREIKESVEDYKNGKYVKGDVKEIMKAIRDCKDETNRDGKILLELAGKVKWEGNLKQMRSS